MEVSLQHMMHARLLWNHLVAAEEKIKRLEEEKEELKIVNECANKKIAELQGQNSEVKQERRTLFVADSHRKSVDFKSVQKVLGGEVCVAAAYNSDQCTMCTLYSFFSFRPRAVGHIVQPRDCCIIEHIFVPTRSVERNFEKIRFP